jgi:hypothetical protein
MRDASTIPSLLTQKAPLRLHARGGRAGFYYFVSTISGNSKLGIVSAGTFTFFPF